MKPWKNGDIIESRWEVFGAARGGMGQVYFVRDAQWGGLSLAVKSLLLKNGQPPSNRAKALFLRESQVWLDLGAHPNIVSGFYTLEVDGALRFFMEYVPGEALSSLLSKGRLPLQRSLDLALQMVVGLEYVHACEVVHRDLKPQNCIISDEDTLRVTDFGLSKQLNAEDTSISEESSAHASISAAGLGTPLYMAPEQWRGLTHAKKPADVYAFGVVLYELLGGVHPFGADSESWRRYSERSASNTLLDLLESPSPPMLAVLQLMHQEVTPISLAELGVQAPSSLLKLASRCLEKDPTARPNFTEIKQELLFLYSRLLGIRYPRSLPPPMRPLTSGENNRAVSYYIMKDTAKAKEILAKQRERDLDALYITLNEKLLRLSCGELSPTQAALEIDRFLRLMHPSASQDPQVSSLQQRLSGYLVRQNITSSFAANPKKAFALGTADGGIHLYDAVTIQRRTFFQASRERVRLLSFSGDGSLFVGGFDDQTAAIFDGDTGHERLRISLGDSELSDLALSPDGALLAIVSLNKQLRIFDTKSGALLLRSEPHASRSTAIVFSPKMRYLATASYDRTIKLWSLTRGLFGWRLTLIHTIARHEAAVAQIAFSHDERFIVSVGLDGLFLATDIEKKNIFHARKTGSTPLSVAIAPNNKDVFIGSQEGEIFQLSLDSQEPPRVYRGHKKPVFALYFVGEARHLLSASEEGVARWSDEPTTDWPLLLEKGLSASVQISQEQEKVRLLNRLYQHDLGAFAPLEQIRREAMPRDHIILRALHEAGLRHGARDGVQEIFVKQSFANVQRAIFSPSAHLLLFEGSRLSIVSPSTGHKVSLQGHAQEVLDAAFSLDGTQLITGAKDNTARFWSNEFDEDSNEPLFPLRSVEHPSWVTAVCWVKLDFFATACQKKIYFWHVGEDSPRWEAESSSNWITSLFVLHERESLLACASDGSYLCLSIKDGAKIFQSIEAGAEEFTSWRELHARPPLRPILCDDDNLLCALDKDALLRDARTNQGLQWFRGAAGPIRCLAASRDGQRVLLGSADKRAYLFDLAGECSVVLQDHQQALCSVAISPDRALLATSEEAQQVRLYDIHGALLSSMELPFIGESLYFDPAGRFLLAQGEGQARLWEILSRWRFA